MRIVHISDLHFGAHTAALAGGLEQRIKELKPELIVCTGDVANQPDYPLLTEAKSYLERIAGYCQDSGGGDPRILVVPGNHDYRSFGFLGKVPFLPGYDSLFSSFKTSHFFKNQDPKVWVFGFNSARLGAVGGSGKVDERELENFHTTYDRLNTSDPDFAKAVKIAAVHHHPLPVNWSHSARNRWLTMTNSGQFLSAMLHRKVDVVIHGHEHLQAQARFTSSLGNNQHNIAVVSLGATLRTVDDPKRNWFSLLTVDHNGARVNFYSSIGDAWSEKPETEVLELRSASATLLSKWEQAAADQGYFYREVASITTLDEDGDAYRVVECEDLTIKKLGVTRAKAHQVALPWTSGYLDGLVATGRDFTVQVVPQIPSGDRIKNWSGELVFNTPLIPETPKSYAYRWNAVNSFALDTRQFDYLYGKDFEPMHNIEFTHYNVADPIQELTVVIKFPEHFRLQKPARVRVAIIDPTEPDAGKWVIDAEAQNDAIAVRALRVYESLNIAALRIRLPRAGLSYGIEWEVPGARGGNESGTVKQLRDLWNAGPLTADHRAKLFSALSELLDAARVAWMREPDGTIWNGPFDVSLMYFDGDQHLRILAAACDEADTMAAVDYAGTLLYGDGIAGRAFKTNGFRVYVAEDSSDASGPNYYARMPQGVEHKVVVSFPVHEPADVDIVENPGVYADKRPYAVVNFGSQRKDCPIALFRLPERSPYAVSFHHQLNVFLFKELRAVFL